MEPNQTNYQPSAPVQPQAPMPSSGGKVPTGVKIIGVLYYIGAGLTLLGSIAFFVGMNFIFPGLGTIGGIVLLVLAVLSFFVAKGLFKLKNWARIVVIILGVLGIVSAITDFSGGSILTLVINGAIVWYLTMSPVGKGAFKKVA